MITDNVKLLLAALRSGEFNQGKEALRRTSPQGDRFCCLGVACEVYRRVTGKGVWAKSTLEDVMAFKRSADANESGEDISFLPPEVRTFFGFHLTDPLLNWNDHQHSAIDMNDGMKLTFDEIADAIERTFREEENANPISD